MLANTPTRYGLVSKVLHWAMALCFIGLIWLGWWMVDLSYYSTWYHRAPELHKAIGLIVLLCAVVMIVWHRISRPPHPQAELKAWEKRASHIAHWVLLASAVLLPVSGYLATTSAGEGVSVFGLFEIPAIVVVSERVRDLSIEVHYYVSYALIGLIAVHAGAALKHQVIDGHGTLRRMLDR